MDEPKEILVEIGGKLVKMTLRYDTCLAVYWGKHMGELVRCKDCIHRYEDGKNVKVNVCELNHNRVMPDDWYCADGERKTDNG